MSNALPSSLLHAVIVHPCSICGREAHGSGWNDDVQELCSKFCMDESIERSLPPYTELPLLFPTWLDQIGNPELINWQPTPDYDSWERSAAYAEDQLQKPIVKIELPCNVCGCESKRSGLKYGMRDVCSKFCMRESAELSRPVKNVYLPCINCGSEAYESELEHFGVCSIDCWFDHNTNVDNESQQSDTDFMPPCDICGCTSYRS